MAPWKFDAATVTLVIAHQCSMSKQLQDIVCDPHCIITRPVGLLGLFGGIRLNLCDLVSEVHCRDLPCELPGIEGREIGQHRNRHAVLWEAHDV